MRRCRNFGALPSVRQATPLPVTSNLYLWLRAGNLTTVDGDLLSTWNDLSGNGNHATAAETARPTFKTNTLNTRPVVRFDGTGNYMDLTSPLSIDSCSIFVVAKTTDAVNNSQPLCTTGDTSYFLALFQTTFSFAHAWPTLVYGPTIPGGFVNSFAIFEAHQNSSNADSYAVCNGITGAAGALSTGTATSINSLGHASNVQSYMKGDIAEIVIYNSFLSASDAALVRSYLNKEYAIY